MEGGEGGEEGCVSPKEEGGVRMPKGNAGHACKCPEAKTCFQEVKRCMCKRKREEMPAQEGTSRDVRTGQNHAYRT